MVCLGYATPSSRTPQPAGSACIRCRSADRGLQIFDHYGLISGGFWWPVLFPAAAIATLVIGVNLIADGLTQAFER